MFYDQNRVCNLVILCNTSRNNTLPLISVAYHARIQQRIENKKIKVMKRNRIGDQTKTEINPKLKGFPLRLYIESLTTDKPMTT